VRDTSALETSSPTPSPTNRSSTEQRMPTDTLNWPPWRPN
jgi:hypothetical protein